MNVAPRMARLAPEHRFRLFVGSDHVADSIPSAPNLEVEVVAAEGLRERLRFTYLEAPRRAAAWGADLFYSFGVYAPVSGKFPVIAAFQNPNVFSPTGEHEPYQRVRLFLLKSLARVAARRDQVTDFR